MSNGKDTPACMLGIETARWNSCVNKITVLWDMAVCRFVEGCQCVSIESTVFRKMETLVSSETLYSSVAIVSRLNLLRSERWRHQFPPKLCAHIPNFRASHYERMISVTAVRNTTLTIFEVESYQTLLSDFIVVCIDPL